MLSLFILKLKIQDFNVDYNEKTTDDRIDKC
jgi:hypothetical protein